MQHINLIKKNVKGVEGCFLMREGELAEYDFERDRLHFLSRSILFLVDSSRKSKMDLRKMSIIAEKDCFIFFHDRNVLGIVASRETNLPLLDMVSYKLLYTIDLLPEKVEEIIDEVLQRMDAFIR